MQGNPLFVVLYDSTLVLLIEELLVEDPVILNLFYAFDAEFDRLS